MKYLLGVVLLSCLGLVYANVLEHSEESSGEFFTLMGPPMDAKWIDPESDEFEPIRLLPSHNGRSERGTCTCPTIFAPNKYNETVAPIPAQMKAALTYAQCIWSCTLASLLAPTPRVRLYVESVNHGGNTLATAGPLLLTYGGKFVPCALLGDSCANSNTAYDMKMSVDPNGVAYYYGTDGAPAFSQWDFVSVALHELGHAFGFISMTTSSGYSNYLPTTFGQKMRYNNQYPWSTAPVTNPSLCTTAWTSGQIYFNGNTYTNGKLYSTANGYTNHWDEATYPAGNINSLMTPQIANGEANHILGPLTCDVLKTIGYTLSTEFYCSQNSSTPATPTPTPSRTRTPTPTRTPASASATLSRSRTPTPSRSRSAVSPTPTPSRTKSPISQSRTRTPTPSRTKSPVSPSPTRSRTRSPVSPTPTPSRTKSPVSATPTPSRTRSPVTPTPTPSRTKSPVSATPTPSRTRSPVTRTPTPSRTKSPVTPTPTPSRTKSPVTPTRTPSRTKSPVSATRSRTPSPSRFI